MVKRRSGPQPNKRWVFTLNNPTPEEEAKIADLDGNLFDYLIVGREGLEPGKTPHLQGFANFTKKKTFNRVKFFFGARCHIEKAKGTDLQNKEYCGKEGNILVEIGAPRFQGQRSDLSSAVSTVLETGSMSAVAAAHPETFVRYYRGLGELLKVSGRMPQRDWKTQVHVIIGPPGCGKSRWAGQFADMAQTYWKAARNKWWDGYTGQEVVVLDDYYGWLPWDVLLRLCDRYPMIVETKGGSVPFLARSILITSNKEPQDWYSSDAVPAVEALFRRITTLAYWKTATTPSTDDPGVSSGAPSGHFQWLSPPCIEFPYEINY
ncbi:replicase [Equine circovirus 1]|uniref:Replicase n=1 Tax=Equine circovirus 1 TaxID=2834422 RepID=A0A8E5XRW0_9CIRC|nr:replicase [Equine circovirus 1]QVK11260.1 replicase [Equine circovirus 1]